MANSSLSVANLDFSEIKSNLKQYLRSQELLKDYDFRDGRCTQKVTKRNT